MDEMILQTAGGKFPLTEYRIEEGGRTWAVLHAGVVFSKADETHAIVLKTNRVPYGVSLWPSAIVLAHEVATRPDFSGKSVLELGAGTGLPGIVAATLGARVTQTDHDEFVLDLCRRNGARNGVEVEYRLADWTAWSETGEYDWIIGADILYVEESHADLRRIFAINRGGRLLLADPFRKISLRLLETLEGEGWGVTVSRWDVDERPIGVFELVPPPATGELSAT